ncbi:MAG: hypothetical protein JXX14_02495 [Deltaproteobacteria bacterium]|nr:hypothetical protein [Deltaproteobacteria bacterium]
MQKNKEKDSAVDRSPSPLSADEQRKQDTAGKIRQLKADAQNSPADYAQLARKRRRKRSIRLVQKLIIFVLLPVIIATVYYYRFASDQYMSTAGVTLKSEGPMQYGIDSLLGSFAGSGSSQEAVTAKEYILSRDMLRLLDEQVGFLKHYKNPKIDYLARLPKDASFEDAFEYYQDMVSAVFEAESGVLILEIKAFDARNANLFAKTIIKLAEDKVNSISTKMQADKINFTRKVVKEAEVRLANAQKNVLAVQKKTADFSPQHSATAAMGLKTNLENALVMAQAELSQARAIMSPLAPKVQALSRRVSALKTQITKENNRLLGDDSDESGLGKNMVEFEMAMLEKELAQKEYQSALVSLEMARLEALKQTRYLVEISSPSLPDEATYPKRWLKILTAFLVSLSIFGIFSLTISAIKEHARM